MSQRLPDEFLLDWSSGAASPPVGLLVASHLALNPAARAAGRALDAAGGAMLDSLPPAAIAPDALARVFARADSEPLPAPPPAPARDALLPAPLAALAPEGIDRLAWRRIVRGVEQARLPVSGGRAQASLLRIVAGRALPAHTHRGLELTLVLDGAFADENGRYARGEACAADETMIHRPEAERARDCVCLIVDEGPIRLTGRFMRLLNPFMPR